MSNPKESVGVEPPTLHRALTFPGLLLFGLSFAAPIAGLLFFGPVLQATEGAPAAPFVILLFIMLLTARSYAILVPRFPLSGSAYNYAGKAINPGIGFVVGWGILLDYFFAPVINSLLIAIYLGAAFPSVPAWVWIIGFTLINTVTNIVGIRFSANLVSILVIAQLIFVVIFVGLSVQRVTLGEGLDVAALNPFFNDSTSVSTLTAAMPLLLMCFLGFDLVTTLVEETKKGAKTVVRAVYTLPIVSAVLGTILTICAFWAVPTLEGIDDPEAASLIAAEMLGGELLGAIFLTMVCVALFASNNAAFASSSRILFAMGRERVLPAKFFGYLSPRFRTPVYSILFVAGFSCLALVMSLGVIASFVSYGALLAFMFVNISVFFQFWIRDGKRGGVKNVLRYIVAPLVGLGAVLWFFTKLDVNALVLGTAWVLVGAIYLAILTRGFRRPTPSMNMNQYQREIDRSETHSEASSDA